jgi:hypothetical protein
VKRLSPGCTLTRKRSLLFIDILKPIHKLRKNAGTLMNSQRGPIEAKTFLHHGSNATTELICPSNLFRAEAEKPSTVELKICFVSREGYIHH